MGFSNVMGEDSIVTEDSYGLRLSFRVIGTPQQLNSSTPQQLNLCLDNTNTGYIESLAVEIAKLAELPPGEPEVVSSEDFMEEMKAIFEDSEDMFFDKDPEDSLLLSTREELGFGGEGELWSWTSKRHISFSDRNFAKRMTFSGRHHSIDFDILQRESKEEDQEKEEIVRLGQINFHKIFRNLKRRLLIESSKDTHIHECTNHIQRDLLEIREQSKDPSTAQQLNTSTAQQLNTSTSEPICSSDSVESKTVLAHEPLNSSTPQPLDPPPIVYANGFAMIQSRKQKVKLYKSSVDAFPIPSCPPLSASSEPSACIAAISISRKSELAFLQYERDYTLKVMAKMNEIMSRADSRLSTASRLLQFEMSRKVSQECISWVLRFTERELKIVEFLQQLMRKKLTRRALRRSILANRLFELELKRLRERKMS